MIRAAPAHAAFRAVILRALRGSEDGVRCSRVVSAPGSPLFRRPPATGPLPSLSRCYASSSKVTLDDFDVAEAYREAEELFPPPPDPAPLPTTQEARADTTPSRLPGNQTLPRPSLPTYDTSFSRVTAYQRKTRRRRLQREEDRVERERMLRWGQSPAPEYKITEELTSRARNVFSELHREGVFDLAQKRASIVSLCRTLIVRGQLLQGMTLLLQLFQANIDAKAFISPRFEGEERESLPLDRIISPQDVSALASDISRVLSAKVEFNRSKDTSIPPWRPESVPADVDHLELPAQLLCAHALATLFDKTVLLGYDPPHAVSAILLSCFSQAMVEATFTTALGLVTELYGFEEMGTAVLSAALSGYGRFSRSEKGELFLRDYAFAHVSRENAISHTEQTSYNPAFAYRLEGCPAPLNGWSQSGAIWTSTIRSKVIEGDMQGAERWLQLYRQARYECKHGRLPQELCPQASCGPYLTVMSGYEWLSVSQEAEQSRRKNLQAPVGVDGGRKIMDVVRLLKDDGIEFTSQMMTFLAKFARRRQKTGSAVDSLKTVQDVGRGGATDKARLEAVRATRALEDGSAEGQRQVRDPDSPLAPLANLTNSDVRTRSQKATQLASQLLGSPSTPNHSEITLEVGPKWDSHTFSEVFDLLTFSKNDSSSGDSHLSGRQIILRLQDSESSASRLPFRPRVLFQTMLSQHLSSTKGNLDRRSPHITSATLYKALRCALDERYRDYPLGLAILQTFRLCNVEVDTGRLLGLITKAMEMELKGDSHSAELLFLAAGLRESEGDLREWRWGGEENQGEYDVFDGKRWVGRGGGGVGESERGGDVQDRSTSPSSSQSPSSSEVKTTSLLSLKNLLRWAMTERIRTSIETLTDSSRRNTHPAWEWDWTQYAPETLHDQYRSSIEQAQRDDVDPIAAPAGLPRKIMAGTTLHESRMSFACVEEVWKGVFELTVRRKGQKRFVCDWEEDEILRVRSFENERRRRRVARLAVVREHGGEGENASRADTQVDAAIAAPVKRGRGRPRKNASVVATP